MLFLIKDIERWGTGTNDIVKECVAQGLPEPIFKEQAGGFGVILRKSRIPEDLDELGLNERQKKAVEYAREKGRITNKIYTQMNKVSRVTATRELTEMVKKGILMQKGTGRGSHFVIQL